MVLCHVFWKQIDVLNISDEDLTSEEHKVIDDVRENFVKHADLIIQHGY